MDVDVRRAIEAPSVRSVERVLDLLAALERADSPLALSDLGRATDLPKATAQRLLLVLERRGLVLKERGRYQLGPAVVPLAGAFLAGSSLTRTSLPILEELAASTGETASLFVREGFDRVVIQRVHSPHPLRYTLRVGQRLPLCLGASGQVLAAAMPEADLLRCLDQAGEIRLATGETLSREELLAKLDRVRQHSLAVSVGERELGVISVSAPVVRAGRGTVAAVAVTGPPTRMTPEKVELVAEEVQRAAGEIGAAYGRW